MLDELEKQYIIQQRDIGESYNIADGGASGMKGKPISEDKKRKIGLKNRANMTGKKLSLETRQKMSRSHSERYKKWDDDTRKRWGEMTSRTTTGCKWSDEARKSFAEKQRIQPNSAKYDVNTVKTIRKMYEVDGISVTDIANKLSMNRTTVYNIATYKRWKYI